MGTTIEEYIGFLEDIEEILYCLEYKIDKLGTIYLNNENLEKLKKQFELDNEEEGIKLEEEEEKFMEALGLASREVLYLPDCEAFYDYENDEYSDYMADLIDEYVKEYPLDPWERGVDLEKVIDKTDNYFVELTYKVVNDEEYNAIKTKLKKFEWVH